MIGILSVIDLILFGLYHRIVARPDRGKIAPFRFLSFLLLIVPNAAYGSMLSIIPVSITNFFVSGVFAGYILSINTNIFSCDSSEKA